MNLGSILALIAAHPQEAEATVSGLVNMFKATTAAVHVVVPAVPATGSAPAVPAVTRKPSPVIRDLQTILVQVLKNNPPTGLAHGWPIKADGWLGDDTEKTIAAGLAMAKPYLAMLG